MPNVYKRIDELVGNTPLIELANYKKKYGLSSNIFAKLEYFNPAGSVKDRVGKAMILDAEKRGILKPDSVIIEPTSGNTGIALSAIATAMGYRVIIVMPESMSLERRKLIKGYGAQLVLTDAKLGMQGAISKADELAKTIKNSFIPNQFSNFANVRAHYETTAPEIYNALGGKIDAFVCGVGTGGTITGVGEYLKQKNPNVKIIAVEPLSSAVLSGKVASSHKIQGIGAGFIPKILNVNVYDEVIAVSDEDAINVAKSVGSIEGFTVGISSGASLYATLQIAKREENAGKNVVTLFADSGEKYLSTELYE